MERKLYMARLGGEPTRISREKTAALMSHLAKPHTRGEGLPDLIWTPGMWRWEPPAEAARFLKSLEQTNPPEELPEEAARSLPERLKGLPRQVWSEFNPKRIWKDMKEIVFGNDPGKAKREWRNRLVWFVLLQYIPVIASIINRGWRIDLMRSAATDGLPGRENVGRHLSEGLLLWGIYLLYLLPEFVFLALTGFKWVEQVIGLAWWAFQHLAGMEAAMSLGEILGGGVLRFMLETVVTLAYPILTWPLYRGAMIRYALEDRIGVFFELRKNWKLAKVNFDTLAGVYAAQKTLWGLYLVFSMVLLATGIGALLIPALLSPLRIIASGTVYIRGLRKSASMQGFFPASAP